MSREKEVDDAVKNLKKVDEYRDIVRSAIAYASRIDTTTVYTREYDFSTPGSKYKYQATSNYVDKYLIEDDLIDAMIKIDKLQEMEIAKMEAKIEAYELALTGKLPTKEPKEKK